MKADAKKAHEISEGLLEVSTLLSEAMRKLVELEEPMGKEKDALTRAEGLEMLRGARGAINLASKETALQHYAWHGYAVAREGRPW